mgnify:CR=1 FL=1
MTSSLLKTRKPKNKLRAVREIISNSQEAEGAGAPQLNPSLQFMAQVKFVCKADESPQSDPLMVPAGDGSKTNCYLYKIEILEKLESQIYGSAILPEVDGVDPSAIIPWDAEEEHKPSRTSWISRSDSGVYSVESVDNLDGQTDALGGRELPGGVDSAQNVSLRNVLLSLYPEGIYKEVASQQAPQVNDYVLARPDNIEGRFIIEPSDPNAGQNQTGGNENLVKNWSNLVNQKDFFQNGVPVVQKTSTGGGGSIRFQHVRVNWACLTAETKKVIEKLADAIYKGGVKEPLWISSAYRTPQYNTSIGGVDDSDHTLGLAFDIPPSKYTAAQRTTIVSAARALGLHVKTSDPRVIHVDRGTRAAAAKSKNRRTELENEFGDRCTEDNLRKLVDDDPATGKPLVEEEKQEQSRASMGRYQN